MAYLLEITAMFLDTLPQGGRIMLLAVILSLAFAGFARVLSVRYGESMHILYRKAVLIALLVVPALVWLLDIRIAVQVEEVQRFATRIPWYATIVFLFVWTTGVVVAVFNLGKRVGRTGAAIPVDEGTDHLKSRMAHWRSRLNLKADPELRIAGGNLPWHTDECVVLPAAVLNWPVGVVDVMLLLQLAQLRNRCWYWLIAGEFVGCVFWFAPWIRELNFQLGGLLPYPAVRLAEAAYRDAEGWRRDFRQLQQRAQMLSPVGARVDGLLRLELGFDVTEPKQNPAMTGETHEVRWTQTRAKRWQKHFDPYERVYWLVASASLFVAVFMTLTIERAPPEFEPRFLEIKWQDRVGPRLRGPGLEQQ